MISVETWAPSLGWTIFLWVVQQTFWFTGFETHGSSSDSSESLNSSLSTSASAMSSPLPQFDSHKKHAAPAVPGNPQLSNVSGLCKLLLLPHTDCHNLVILLNMQRISVVSDVIRLLGNEIFFLSFILEPCRKNIKWRIWW